MPGLPLPTDTLGEFPCITTPRQGRCTMSHAEQPRRFAISDVLVLIAGLAAGLALARATSPEFTTRQLRDALLRPRGGWTLWHAFGLTLELGMFFFIPFVAGCTPACLLLQLARPRPPWRRLRRRPGFVACLIATAFVVVTLSIAMVLLATSAWEFRLSSDRYLVAHVLGGLLAGFGVTAGWSTMKLCGACRPAPAWPDRLGRLTGAIWVAVGAISLCYAAVAMA